MTPNYMNNEDFEKQFLSEDYQKKNIISETSLKSCIRNVFDEMQIK